MFNTIEEYIEQDFEDTIAILQETGHVTMDNNFNKMVTIGAKITLYQKGHVNHPDSDIAMALISKKIVEMQAQGKLKLTPEFSLVTQSLACLYNLN